MHASRRARLPPRSRRLAFAALASFTSLQVLAGVAEAGTCDRVPLVSTCVNSDTLWPHAGASSFLGFGGTDVVSPGHVGFGLVTTYQSRPIVFHVPSPGPDGSDQSVIDDQVNASFLWSLGITKRLELDFVLPVTLGQGGSGIRPITGSTVPLSDTAMRDLRFGLAYALVPRAMTPPFGQKGNVWALTGRFEVSAPTGDKEQFASDRGTVFVPSLAADYRRGRWFAGAEIGARIRPVTNLVGARIGTQLMAGVGVGFDVLRRDLLSAVIEARALPTLTSQESTGATDFGLVSAAGGQALVPAEWSISARTSPLLGGDLGIQLGGGGGIPFGGDLAVTTPRFRFTLSLRYAPVVRDTDGDGILDADDRCPRERGPRPSGCPPVPEPPVPEPDAPAAASTSPSAPSSISPVSAAAATSSVSSLVTDPDVCKDACRRDEISSAALVATGPAERSEMTGFATKGSGAPRARREAATRNRVGL